MDALFRRLIAMLGLLLTGVLPAAALAETNIDRAFSGLMRSHTGLTVNDPGHFQTQSRNILTAGGLDIRIPKARSATLFSITPPSYNLGCGGISFFFGGFSFISSQELVTMLRSIAQAAPAFVLQAAVKTLCAQCDAIIQFLKNLAQRAASMSLDACRAANGLKEKILSEGGPGSPDTQLQSQQGFCAARSSAENQSSDFLTGLNDMCATASKTWQQIRDWLYNENPADATSPDAVQKRRERTQNPFIVGNQTWDYLMTRYPDQSSENYRIRTFILNLVGTWIIRTPPAAGDQAQDGVEGNAYYGPTLDARDAFNLYMCGTPIVQAEGGVTLGRQDMFSAQYCMSYWGNGRSEPLSKKIWACAPGHEGSCMEMQPIELGMAPILQGQGVLHRVHSLMRKGVEAVRENRDIFSPEYEEVRALIEATPFPLYQVINLAAIYPSAASELVNILAVLTSEFITYELFNDLLRSSWEGDRGVYLSTAQIDRMESVLHEMRRVASARKQEITNMMAMQEGINAQIRQINKALQQQVLTRELLGGASYSQSLIRAGISGKTGAGSQP